ncbi:SPOR domain-containing protein [Thermocrinis minervae]|uniref:Tfp pilus assembly protein PilF n=1 Tax=Thermocrinis minervae TaxID=381751 RepID=A0A1M6SRQ3_9AQUI|nr:tetratricopeptide repeat protein [Thermocrinis minervae]SHK47317.1 Tfp pilus assembly protein PilF [Thermocrinis minervae]
MIRRFSLLLISLTLFSCADLQKQDEEKKNLWQYYYDMGNASFVAKDYSSAIANYYKAVQENPKEPKLWNALGLAYMEVKEYEKAENAFLRALGIDGSYTLARMNLGILYLRKGEYLKAINFLENAAQDETFEKRHEAFYYLAKVYQAMNKEDEYIKNLQKSANYNPIFLPAQLELAEVYKNHGEYDKAESIYLFLLGNNIDPHRMQLMLAQIYYEKGDFKKAKDYIGKVLESKDINQDMKSLAYDLLTKVLVKEQEEKLKARTIDRTIESKKDKLVEYNTEKVDKGGELKQKEKEESKSDIFREISLERKKYYSIQLFASNNRSSVENYKEKLEKSLSLSPLRIIEDGGLYKLLYGSFDTRQQAEKEKKNLEDLNIQAFIILTDK